MIRVLTISAMIPPLLAETVVQPETYATSNEGGLYSGTDTTALAAPGYFTASFEPFDESLGTLVSFNIQCEINGALDGFVDAGAESGFATGSLGGTFLMNGIPFDGTGGSNGTGGAGGDPLQAEFAIPSYDRTLVVADAGVAFNPALAEIVAGEAPFDLTYDSAVYIDYGNASDLLASVAGSLTMTYTYQPAAGGLATLKVVGIVRDPTNGEVTIEWTSEPEKTYAVEAGGGLESDDMEVIAPSVPAESGETTTFTESVPLTNPRRFYRIRENE